MFTGIVEELGAVRRPGSRLAVGANKVLVDTGPGSSIAVNGVCLTATSVDPPPGGSEEGILWFDLSEETLARTALGRLAEGDPVNLERPVTLLMRLGGHLVQGHVDAVGEVASVQTADPGCLMTMRLPEELNRYVAPKGSIAVDGVSLTVTEIRDGAFGVALIPYTLRATTLGTRSVGDPVNLEVDVMAKYAERLLAAWRERER